MPINIQVLYNFKEVKNAALLLIYLDDCKQCEKILLDNNDGIWQLDEPDNITKYERFSSLPDNVKEIINKPNDFVKHHIANTPKLLESHAVLLFNLCN